LVLCVLEGQSREQAAAELGLAPGTLSSRIAWAKKVLAQRLTRRGVTLCLATALASSVAPTACATAAMQHAMNYAATGTLAGAGAAAPVAALTQEVLNTMFYQMLAKTVGIVIMLATATSGLIWLTLAVQAGGNKDAPPDPKRILGEWKTVSVTDGGRPSENKARFIFTKEKLTMAADGRRSLETTYRIDPSKHPKWIDSKSRDGKKDIRGIYKFDGKRLIVCINEVPDGQRPDRFASEPGSHNDMLMVLERK
jgi:uncharacterized protein (TIGR03067 family)